MAYRLHLDSTVTSHLCLGSVYNIRNPLYLLYTYNLTCVLGFCFWYKHVSHLRVSHRGQLRLRQPAFVFCRIYYCSNARHENNIFSQMIIICCNKSKRIVEPNAKNLTKQSKIIENVRCCLFVLCSAIVVVFRSCNITSNHLSFKT